MAKEYIDGATAIARGALAAGCDFFAGYPITPATPILLHMVNELPKVGGVGIEAEDEIGAISMCIGAAMSGARPFTATSGPGISLYSENIGLAIMGEVPLVIVDVMRMGPATGGATTPAQGDVQFVRWGTSGGYPIIALAPSSVAECYTLTMRAFDLAERFRTPVFLLVDKEMIYAMATVDIDAYVDAPVGQRPLVPQRLPEPAVVDGVRVNAVTGQPDPRLRPEETYLPYAFEPIDAAPPASPFGGPHITRFTTSSHDEHGFLTKDPEKVGRLNHHLRLKILNHRHEMAFGIPDIQEEARTLFISYGTTARAMREAVDRARDAGKPVSGLTLHTLWPTPERMILDAVSGHDRIIVAELNHGQYIREIERLVYRDAARQRVIPPEIIGLNRTDGELITPEQFLDLL
ncbi:MAG TPA: pyruvate flavodoxin/ferredoxin oxidoreductase [Caldilineae bacterium]|nr:pyruvate flavodoxin/ferredoxin oxidoreductase [Caldilineae bacterium]